ncbi:MAG: glycine-rich domain-containing protein [Methylococcales bacterium]
MNNKREANDMGAVTGDKPKIVSIQWSDYFDKSCNESGRNTVETINASFFWILGIIGILMGVFSIMRPTKSQKQIAYIRQYSFDPSIVQKLKNQYQDLTRNEINGAFEGLRDFFNFCNQANGQMISMPSQVVDDAWHEFILFTAGYEQFCQNAFGRFLHHTPAEAMTSPTQAQDGLKRVWRLACEREKLDPRHTICLPLLFALDAELEIPGGIIYSLEDRPEGNPYWPGNIDSNPNGIPYKPIPYKPGNIGSDGGSGGAGCGASCGSCGGGCDGSCGGG